MQEVDLGRDESGERYANWETVRKIALARAEGDREKAERMVCGHYGPKLPRKIFGTAFLARRKV